MATFLMFGKYTTESLKGVSAPRTQQAIDLVKQFDGEVKAIYATLGQTDLVCIADFPDVGQVIKASVALTKLTGIAFSTQPAVSVQEFDKLVSEV